MMNTKQSLGLYKHDTPLYDPTRLQQMEESFFVLFCSDYLTELGFPLKLYGLKVGSSVRSCWRLSLYKWWR